MRDKLLSWSYLVILLFIHPKKGFSFLLIVEQIYDTNAWNNLFPIAYNRELISASQMNWKLLVSMGLATPRPSTTRCTKRTVDTTRATGDCSELATVETVPGSSKRLLNTTKQSVFNTITIFNEASWSCTDCHVQSFRMLLIMLKIIQADPSDKDDSCLREISYDFDDDSNKNIKQTNYEEDNFDLRKHLMRSHLAFFILGIVLLAIAIIVTTIGCWCLWITVCVLDTISSKLEISEEIN